MRGSAKVDVNGESDRRRTASVNTRRSAVSTVTHTKAPCFRPLPAAAAAAAATPAKLSVSSLPGDGLVKMCQG